MIEAETLLLPAARLDDLLAVLRARGHEIVGPVLRDEAIVYDRIASAADLPAGWTDEQGPGHYRLKQRSDGAYFGYVVGPHSWKKYLFPPRQTLWRARRTEDGFTVEDSPQEPPRYAFLGVRSCELAAMAVQDRVFLGPDYQDPVYQVRRDRAFLVAVECVEAGGSCFCAAMQTGPAAKTGFDLALTEIVDEDRHVFLCRVGSTAGKEVAQELGLEPADDAARSRADRLLQACSESMTRKMPANAREVLAANPEHSRWDEVAARCLACSNCTMVCPTCFCSTVEDVTDLSGTTAERQRRWDSCFTLDFSFIHGGNIRQSTRARYRQWLTHKLSSWHDQFDSSGCVGCGRCITWCPSGIDLTEEVAAMAKSATGSETSGAEG